MLIVAGLDNIEHSVFDALSNLGCHLSCTNFMEQKKSVFLFFSSMFTVSPISSDIVSESVVKEQVREMNKEIAEKTEKYKKCKQMLAVSKQLLHKAAQKVPVGAKP